MKNKRLVAVFVVTFILLICCMSLLVLFTNNAEAVPPKLDWVYITGTLYHCEAATYDHCLPASALWY